MPRRMPVKDPKKIKYIGPASRMFQNAYAGPVTGNGYLAQPGQVIDVEAADYEALIATRDWAPALRRRTIEKQDEPPATEPPTTPDAADPGGPNGQ